MSEQGRRNRLIKAALLVVAAVGTLRLESQSSIQVGYLIMSDDAGSHVPVASALFTYTNNNGILISQAGVGATEQIRLGRIFVDEQDARTAVVFVNPSTNPASVNLILRNAVGQEVGRRTERLLPRQHLPRYIYQLFPTLNTGFTGSLSFESDRAIAALTLRESRNGLGEPLYTTLPVIDVSQSDTNAPVTFPHLATGEGYTTQLLLMNRTAQPIHGMVRLTASDGSPLVVRWNETTVSELTYQIDAQGIFRVELDSEVGLRVGYASVIPDVSSASPAGAVVFRLKKAGQLITEAGVQMAIPTTLARIFVDNAGAQTGLAIANTSNAPANLTIVLMDRSGAVESRTDRVLPPRNHLAIFAQQLFPTLTDGFTGLIEVRSSVPIVPVTLKLTINGRGDSVLTTLPVADMTSRASAAQTIIPQIAFGGGFSTRLIFVNDDSITPFSGTASFYESDGSALTISLNGNMASRFPLTLLPGSGRQLFPGNTASVASISMIDPETGENSTEIIVNEGNSVRPHFRVIDTAGQLRDDFDPTYSSLDSDVASVDSTGAIQGGRRGFSTLTITAGNVVAVATVTVVRIDSGPRAFDTAGIVQDSALRLYLASSSDHAILLAQDLKQVPEIYAGVRQTPGFKNDLRTQSLFRNPGFLARNSADGTLYVSDTANHVIRKIRPGPTGNVETLAGTGTPGNQDGPAATAMFNNPQGVALDSRGNLWVADSGNHTIRRINLITKTVNTIAGMPGEAGLADGLGRLARFRFPQGIAIETEAVAAQIFRELKGDPGPPIRVIVADSGNNTLRRVTESGQVETIGKRTSLRTSEQVLHRLVVSSSSAAGASIAFDTPTGIAIDPAGNIYVSEFRPGRVRVLLRNGEVVAASQGGTFQNPKGIVITRGGRVVVGESARTAREIAYGEPQITSIAPDRIGLSGGEILTIKGRNFSPDSLLVIGSVVIANPRIVDTSTITVTAPALLSGLATLTVQNRAGIAQAALEVEPVPFNSLTAGYITTVAGGSTFSGDGGSALEAALNDPVALGIDSTGNLYIAESENYRIRRVDARTGIITTIAGTGEIIGSRDENLPATAAAVAPAGLAVDSSDNIYFSEPGKLSGSGSRIRKIDALTGRVATVAGGSGWGFSGDNGPAISALIDGPEGLAFDARGSIYIADFDNNRIRRLDLGTGTIATVAGSGPAGFSKGSFSGDGGLATASTLNNPWSVAVDAAGSLYIADSGNNRVRRVSDGVITTVAGNGSSGPTTSGGSSVLTSVLPLGVAVDSRGNIYTAEPGINRIRKIDPQTGILTAVMGTGVRGFSGDGSPATAAAVSSPFSLTVDSADNIYVADTRNNRVRRIDARSGIAGTVAGTGEKGYTGDNGPATVATLGQPVGVAADRLGNWYISEHFNHRVRKVNTRTGNIITVAGTGRDGFSGDGGPANTASLSYPSDLTIDPAGNLYIADFGNNRIRKIAAQTGIITTFAGTGAFGFSGDNGPAVTASLSQPENLATDPSGNIYMAGGFGHRIRMVNSSTGIITTVAGTGQAGFSGDNGPAANATLNMPDAIAFDATGNLYFADNGNLRIRKVDGLTGIISSVLSSGVVYGLAFDGVGRLYIAERFNSRIRRLDIRTGSTSTIAGTGAPGYTGDGGPATSAALSTFQIAFDPAGNLIFADGTRVRAIRGPLP